MNFLVLGSSAAALIALISIVWWYLHRDPERGTTPQGIEWGIIFGRQRGDEFFSGEARAVHGEAMPAGGEGQEDDAGDERGGKKNE